MIAYDFTHRNPKKRELVRAEDENLMDTLFRRCDCFSLTESVDVRQMKAMNPDYAPDVALENALSPYKIRRFCRDAWYGWVNVSLVIRLYPCIPEVRELLRLHHPTIFPDPAHRRKSPSLEDICFYRDEKMLLGTLTHERMCTVFPLSEDAPLLLALSHMGILTECHLAGCDLPASSHR